VKTYICDLDGTVADISHRLHYIDRTREGGPDWDAFFDACGSDEPIQNVIDVVRAIGFQGWHDDQTEIIYLTGRSERVRDKTTAWLHYNGLPKGELIMRRDGDHRPDTITKRELMEKLASEGRVVVGVFEDRPSMCRLWRELGLTVFQVGSGEEF
jgi:hypothetical protein